MAMLDLTIQVSDLSPKVTLMDINTFFSYCGTVTNIQLERKGDQSQSALVTFTQPYALRTALLLNDAIIADSRIRVLPLKNSTSHSISDNINYNQNNDENRSITPTRQSIVEAMANKGYKTLKRSKEEVEGKYKISNKGVLDKAAKYTAELGSQGKRRDRSSAGSRNEYHLVPWI